MKSETIGKKTTLEFFDKKLDDLGDYIKKYNVKAEIIDLEVEMKTSDLAAKMLNTDLKNIFKSMVLHNKKDKEVAVVVLAGDAKMNLELAAEALGWKGKKISFATREVALEKTGYPAGGIPPFGYREKLKVVVDKELENFDEGYGGGGRYEYMVKIHPKEIIRVTNAIVTKVGSVDRKIIDNEIIENLNELKLNCN